MPRKNLLNIDFAELRQQKEWLYRKVMSADEEESNTAAGVLHLFDALQDWYVEEGWAHEQEVYGDIPIVDHN